MPPEASTSPLPADPLAMVAVALDTADWDELGKWCELFGPRVGVLKLGLEAFVRFGPPAVELATRHARAVFLDLKLHDIPNTVAAATRVAAGFGVRYLTVHVGGGSAMLDAAVAATAGSQLGILGVTVLTSLDDSALTELEMAGSSVERVLAWSNLAAQSGCAGLVCSPLELVAVRRRHARPFTLVSPGIRPSSPGSATTGFDQKRVATARDAVAHGADLLVIGRPLTRAPNPDAALTALAAELGAT